MLSEDNILFEDDELDEALSELDKLSEEIDYGMECLDKLFLLDEHMSIYRERIRLFNSNFEKLQKWIDSIVDKRDSFLNGLACCNLFSIYEGLIHEIIDIFIDCKISMDKENESQLIKNAQTTFPASKKSKEIKTIEILKEFNKKKLTINGLKYSIEKISSLFSVDFQLNITFSLDVGKFKKIRDRYTHHNGYDESNNLILVTNIDVQDLSKTIIDLLNEVNRVILKDVNVFSDNMLNNFE